MERFIIALVVLSFGLALPAAGQTPNPSLSNAEAKEKEKAINLNEDQKQAVIDAAVAAKSRQKTPKDFSPSLGAAVPKEVYLHGFTPEVTQKNPALKNYTYAYLDREVILVAGPENAGPQNTVAAVVPLPEKLVSVEQPHQGAAEASDGTSTSGKAPTASVPSHTSPETIK